MRAVLTETALKLTAGELRGTPCTTRRPDAEVGEKKVGRKDPLLSACRL